MNPDEATSLKQLFLSMLPKDGGIVVGTVTKESPLTIQIETVSYTHLYQATGATPELVIQGIMDDANSDYYAAHGSDVVTCVGCVLTGDLPLTALDAESGSVVDDVINFNIKNII